MFDSFKLLLALITLLCFVSTSSAKSKAKPKHGPGGMSFNDTTTCEEFSKYARFNPYSVLYQQWFVFYYWAPPQPIETFIFTFPTANHTKHLRKLLNGNTVLPVDWSARQILMENHLNVTSLLVERGDRGQYWHYLLHSVEGRSKIRPRDIRIKQTGDNKILGIMDCDKETVLALSKIEEVPPKNRLQDEAARLGFRSRRGKSYLYQGHEWMPIPEDDEKHYWGPKKIEKSPAQSSNEIKSSEKSNEEVESKTDDALLNAHTSKSVDPLSGDQENNTQNPTQTSPVSTKEVETSKLDKTPLGVQETNVVDIVLSTDEPDRSLENNEIANDLSNDRDNLQVTYELDKPQTVDELDSKNVEITLRTTDEPFSLQPKQKPTDQTECTSCNNIDDTPPSSEVVLIKN